MADEVDGMLDDWSLCRTRYDDMSFVVGTITGDRKARFRDGTLMTTSLLVTPVDDPAEGATIETLNSRYRLGMQAKDVSLQAFLYAASLHGVVIGPDGEPVERIDATLTTAEGDKQVAFDAKTMAGVAITFD